MNKLRITAVSLLLFGVGIFGLKGAVRADDYNVNAVVPYAQPSQAATIDTPSTGKVTQNAQQIISGACQVMSPELVISIWRNGQVLGSTVCSSGAYSLTIILALGQNTLIARTANGNGVYGPDSTAVNVILSQPVVIQLLPPEVNQPSGPLQQIAVTNAGSRAGLSLTTLDPFGVLTSDKMTTTIRVVVGGGDTPYVLQLNWGDGTTESRSIDQPGSYEFTHTYRVQRDYTVLVRVRDVKGAYSEYAYAVISNKPAVKSPQAGSKPAGHVNSGYDRWTVWRYVGVFVALVSIIIITYLLGYRRAEKHYRNEIKPPAKTDKSRTRKKI